MKAVILAAGYATRLYPLTIDKPKCLLPVSGRTILDRLIEKLSEVSSLEEIVVVTNDRFYPQLELWRNNSKSSAKITLVNDGTTSNENRLGAVGDLQFAIQKTHIQSDILLLASDNLFEGGFKEFIAKSEKNPDSATIAVYDLKDPQLASKKYGVVESDASGKVLNIEEKPEFPKTSLIGMGVYYFPKKTLPLITEYLGQKDANDAPGFYVRWLMGRLKIFCFVFKGLWYDIGDLKSLDEANRIFK